ncbi:MAG: 16S rRNA (guanine(966)-N(2))-methyltransferase RsmD [Candidatus Brocadiales bacterium]
MRVIAGIAKGRHLYCPRGLGIRPARDRVKESLFNILGGLVIDRPVLDLFAGTGAMGIEALSRGAQSCLFVENNVSVISYIHRNLRTAGLESRGKVLKMDAFRVLPHFVKKGVYFELAFVDPPYKIVEDTRDRKRLIRLLEGLTERNILRYPGIVVLEYRAKRVEMPDNIGRLVRFDERSYDATHLGFWHLSEE